MLKLIFHRHTFFLLLYITVTKVVAQPADTLHNTVRDTAAVYEQSGIDTVITYTAKDSVVYYLKNRTMHLYASSEMHYGTIHLKSERIDINWDTATLTSYGVELESQKDSVIGKPVLLDNTDEYHGEQIDYNFRTQKGRIVVGTTNMDNGYYRGETIKKIEKDELFVANGRYTTCDHPNPHFYFESPKMKIYVRDIVVAEPVYFYVADVPVFALPFGIFPSHGGRASGFIMPAYGQDRDYGWYLSHLGYYWAASDYWDITTLFDLYARGKWRNQTELNYSVRNVLDGSLSASITSISRGEESDPDRVAQRDYFAHLRHNQIISPTSKIDVDFTFASSTYFKNYSTSLNQLLTQNIISNATYSKWWSTSNRSLSVSLFRDQNLITGDVHERLPSLSFSQSQIYPFRKKKSSRGLTGEASDSQSFADLFGLNYGANFSNDRFHRSTTFDSAFTNGAWQHDVKDFNDMTVLSFAQNASMNISPKVGHFTVSPSISWNESRRMITGSTVFQADSTLARSDTSAWETQGYVNAALGISTRFYGLAQPRIFGITAFRHTVSPSLSFSYNKKIYGGFLPKYQLLGSLSIGNIFEMKTAKSDTTQGENKIQLLNVGVATSYNFAADSMNFNDISINYRTDIGSFLNLSGTAVYSLYEFDPAANRGSGARVNRYLLTSRHRFADLKSFSISFSTSLRGEKRQSKEQSSVPQHVLEEQELATRGPRLQPAQRIYETLYDREEADFSIPWQLNFSYTFSQSQNDPRKKFRTSSATASLSFNLTEKWKFDTRGSYDFVSKKHYLQSLSITRDLHCWQMNFTYYPMGTLAGFRFELRVAAPQLQDIKITKQTTRP